MKVSAVIPTRNRQVDLVRAIESVLCQTRVPDQLVIIDQSPGVESKTATADLLGLSSVNLAVSYIHDPGIAGLVAAKDFSLGINTGDIVMFLEDDVILQPDYVQNLLQGFVDKPNMMGSCGVLVSSPTAGKIYRYFFKLFHRGIFYDRRVDIHGNPAAWEKKFIQSAYLSGGVSAYRRSVFEKVRFDTCNDFFMLEDIDFSTRAVREFGKDRFFINTSARLNHLMSDLNRARLAGRYERKLREFLVFYKKNRDQPWARASLLWLLNGLFLEAVVATIKLRNFGPVKGYFAGLISGIRYQVKWVT